MKNKKLMYILIPLTLFVWGIIIYKIFDATKGENDDNRSQPVIRATKEAYNYFELPKDTAKLLLNYNDPFASSLSPDTTKKSNTGATIIKFKSKPDIKSAFNWNFIKYSGYVQNPGSKSLIGIVKINGKIIMLSEGETSSGVKLIKNLKDSIKISFDDKATFIKLQ
jgi:hypothetical protein